MSDSCSRELPKCASEKLFAKMYFVRSACEALLVSPIRRADRSVRDQSRIGPHSPRSGFGFAWADQPPDKGMHLLVTPPYRPCKGCIETMRSYVTIVTRYL